MYMKFELDGATNAGSPYILWGTRKQCRDEYDSLVQKYNASPQDFTFGGLTYTCYALPLGGWRIRDLFFDHSKSKHKIVRTFDKLDEALTWMENISS